MKVVVDTNVFVSGLMRTFGKPARVVDLVRDQRLTLLIDERILYEYREVLKRPRLKLPVDDVDEMLAMIDRFAVTIAANPHPLPIPDPDDVPFLEVALSGEAECLITGNKKDFGKPPKELKILTPAEFLEFYRKSLMD